MSSIMQYWANIKDATRKTYFSDLPKFVQDRYMEALQIAQIHGVNSLYVCGSNADGGAYYHGFSDAKIGVARKMATGKTGSSDFDVCAPGMNQKCINALSDRGFDVIHYTEDRHKIEIKAND
jgi:hypothetical protein